MSDELFYEPRRGEGYGQTRTLILSESAYDWNEEGEEWKEPESGHPDFSVDCVIRDLETNGYMKKMTQALCREEAPTAEQRRAAWNRYAYSIYVPRSVGRGSGTRPSAAQWKEAAHQFRVLVGQLAPRKVIITGLDAWNRMPATDIHFGDRCQAYRVGGRLVWCLALPHTANRIEGFRWSEVGELIAAFTATDFPEVV